MLRTEFAQLREQAGISIKDLANEAGFTQRTLYRWEKGEAVPRKAVMTLLQNKIAIAGNGQCKFRFIDLFAGIGGLRRGFDRIGGQCVFTSEWNIYSQKTYRANYACNHEIAGDITKISERDIPHHDILLAGFPCQPFSIAGVSKKISLGLKHGFACETQGNLFFDVARIIRYHRPRCFLLENVKNLVSHDRGRTFSIIRNVLEHELGYCLHWRIIDGKGFVPQHRERIFIVGFLDKNDFSFDTLSLPDPLSGPRLSAILHPENGSEKPESHYTVGEKASVSEKYTLSDKLWKYLQNYADKHKKAGNGFGFGLCDHDSVARTLSARYYKDGSEILVSQGCDKNPRRLTPRECARLMGFDRPGQSDFKIPVSDTQAYRQFGNAVVVPVVEAVASHILPHLQN
ncbi:MULTISPECIES: DNA (cytosine-5-)-methyltransferase [Commensalibacter]|uniref:DNA (cytosine-5-)-methyltransferase n=1 Tax=Commensalibacter TaxID=1079922 RepID=UPI0018DC7868|nr:MULTISPECIES: DNA (cytosine-5-)-methyltransferase [Commensalibacter]MBH9972631.1 DNA (cytosine-5-)-methyltransferase [Commensalibacter melissae]MBI0016837.1 DNA (cytosine-5-)-methyltransferase [Commensalibacter sp. B14384M2]MBI0018582.1 DNA (cytosine-5-)-methyltransferase [Commensalibacter sp. W8133]MBI0050037.1 DNA (cytosine-5-)-methyltransferase [Commensalibacter sp. B14384M3]MBI0179221.1 DNA (cytosine-5-)-methyltransferase [Commensalibacter sp. W8163]